MPKELNENAKKWVAALRSGEYAQTQFALKNYKGHCCLGVGCDVYGKETGENWQEVCAIYKFMDSSAQLPEPVQKWFGLRSEAGRYKMADSLMADNDSRKRTFAEIADIIESQPEGLFV